MSPTVLAAALVLSRVHGPALAACFLIEQGIAVEVIAELLFDTNAAYMVERPTMWYRSKLSTY
jgi:hypothetical protein